MVEPEQHPQRSKKKGHGKAAALSCALWVLSLVLSFTIPPQSPYIWLPDATLLTGFIPLLFSWSPSWTWLLFGLCNFAIGCFLLLISNIPDDPFPAELHPGKHHLVEFHPWYTWMIIGILITIYGIIRMIKNVIIILRARQLLKKTGQDKVP